MRVETQLWRVLNKIKKCKLKSFRRKWVNFGINFGIKLINIL